MDKGFDWESIAEKDRIAYYGALISMAAIDGSLDRDEVTAIYEVLDLDSLSEEGRRHIHAYLVDPPDLEQCMTHLSKASAPVRFGLMMGLIDVALTDDIATDEENEALDRAQRLLEISDEQRQAMWRFAAEAKRIKGRGIDDSYAADSLKNAAAGLTAVGVPVAAVYFSGSVLGLSAAGITSGLAALGLGLGMVPGIGTAIALGIGIYCGVRHVLGTGNKRKKQQLNAERERRAQQVIRNMQQTINALTEHVHKLQEAAAESDANREALRRLAERLRILEQAINRRRAALQVQGA